MARKDAVLDIPVMAVVHRKYVTVSQFVAKADKKIAFKKTPESILDSSIKKTYNQDIPVGSKQAKLCKNSEKNRRAPCWIFYPSST